MGKYFGWVGVGGDEWGWVRVSAVECTVNNVNCKQISHAFVFNIRSYSPKIINIEYQFEH